MSVNFENTSYLDAIKRNVKLIDEGKIQSFANANPQFHYGDVSFKKFCNYYSPGGWCGRKVYALPLAIWSLVIKTIYHLAKAVIVGIGKACSGDSRCLKAHIFYVGRDFQEAFGWLVSLFNDRYGQYHIQESVFHKSCYDSFLIDPLDISASLNFAPASFNFDISPRLNSIHLDHNPVDFGFPAQVQRVPADIQETPYLMDKDLDKEFKKIRDISDTTLKEKRFVLLAEAYLSKGDLEKALKTIKELYSDTKTKELVTAKVASAFLLKGDKEQAVKAIKEIYSDTKVKEAFLAKVAESYFTEGDLNNALKTIKELYSDTETKELVIANVASAFLLKGDKEQAFKAIKEIYSDTKTKEAFIAKVAESYFTEGDLEKALKTIKELYSDRKTKESITAKIASAFLVKGDKEQAFKAIKEIYGDTETKEVILTKIAVSYYDEGDLEKALKIIKELYRDTQTKETFISKIANAFLKKGDKENAIEAIKELDRKNDHLKMQFFIQIAQSAFSNKDEAGVLDAIHQIVMGALVNKFLAIGKFKIFYETMMEVNISNNVISNFFVELGKCCYEQAKVYFSSGDTQAILKEIITKATDSSTMQAFLNLNPRRPDAGFEFPKSAPKSSGDDSKSSKSRPKASRSMPKSATANPYEKYYSVLGLNSTASKSEVNKKYRKLALKYHPDKIRRDDTETESAFEKRKIKWEEKFKKISGAYAKLNEQ
jgi:Flp pilus assembly protein TadD